MMNRNMDHFSTLIAVVSGVTVLYLFHSVFYASHISFNKTHTVFDSQKHVPGSVYLMTRYIYESLRKKRGTMRKNKDTNDELVFTLINCRYYAVSLRRFCSVSGYGWDYPDSVFRDVPLCYPEFLFTRLLTMIMCSERFKLSPLDVSAMVTKDNANSGSGGKTTCVKKQKCIMNNSQKPGALYRDPQKTIFEPKLTLEVTADDAGRKTNPVAVNGVIETTASEQTCNVWSVSNLQNLKEMQYLHHEAEDSRIDPSLDMDKSSLMGFVDSGNLESSEDVQTVPCIQVDVKTDVVLIDEDDDDLSLRERTVTDVSTADGNAAELVCGRLQSISSDSTHSLCDRQSLEQGSTIETPQEKQELPKKHKRACCLCVII